MSEHWDIYFGYMEDKIASVLLDMDVWQEIDTEEYNHGFAVRIKLKNPNEDGFPIDEEADRLNILEDTFNDFVQSKNFINVGRITSDGVREVIFYSNQEQKHVLIEAADRFIKPAHYNFEIFDIQEDETWEFYFDFLYPNKYQQQHMGNRQVVDSLEQSGDSLEVPRKVEHWIFFADEKMMNRFIKAIKKEGFTIEDQSNEMEEEEHYAVCISREDKVDLHSINNVTDLLIEVAENFEGEYDGWETFVIQS
ncbi:MAG TPA: DUF695 domain-containing protein [Bacillus sp. (in: firmicutes)]|nr:DUF695 domain-containing protein [Bacillus sp. (in: firmicutes)]